MKVSSCRNHNQHRWRVSWRERGATKRRFFKTKQEAADFATLTADALKAHGEAWGALTGTARAELIACWTKAQEKGYSVSEACRYFESHGPRTASSTTVALLCAKFIAAKLSKGLRSESLRLLETTLEQFRLGRETQKAANVTTEEISDWLGSKKKWGPWRRRGAIIDLGNLFSWGNKVGLLVRNPVAGIERPTIEHKTPVVLSPGDAKRLLKLCGDSYPTLLPWLAISLFAGLRAAEVERLQWSDVGEKRITLASHQTKGRARRLVTIRQTLEAWLKRKTEGPVCPDQHRKLCKELRKTFGGLPKNVLRHSFISYALGAGETVDAVAMEAGNTPDVIFRHYREIVTPEQAAEFWSLLPGVIPSIK